MLHLFSAPGIDLDAFWGSDGQARVSTVQAIVVKPCLAQQGLSAVASPGHMVLKLALIWSQSGSEYLVESFFTPEVLTEIVQLLKHPKLTKPVAKTLVEVIANLVFSQGKSFAFHFSYRHPPGRLKLASIVGLLA